MGLHDGHRERLKARFRTEGADRLQDHELLELLLFYAIPRSDTNEIAHKLLLRFGSLQGVLEAEIPALCTVEGVGENTATLLKSVSALYQRTELRAAQTVRVLSSAADAAEWLAPRYRNLDCECVYLLCLDGRRRILSCQEIARGVPTRVEISVRTVVETALKNAAKAVILAHNHPDAPAAPSREDEMITLRVSEALATVGITLMDHIILSDSEYVSMADSGILAHTRRPFRPIRY